jgi:hypothetical protein
MLCRGRAVAPETAPNLPRSRRKFTAAAGPIGLVLAGLLLGGCGGDTSTRLCFGSEAFCHRVFDPGRAPVADAGGDLEARSGQRVVLDGTDSFDPDGRIVEFAWVQESGPAVAIDDATDATAEFTAPSVAAATELVFRLLVTDHQGESDRDRVRVTVLPEGVTAAARTGLGLLNGRLTLTRVLTTKQGGASGDFVGLWLGARVLAAELELEPDLDAFLDELRVTMILLDTPPHAVAAPDATLQRLGRLAVARFTAERDPGTAERALAALHDLDRPQPSWREAVAARAGLLPHARTPAPRPTDAATAVPRDRLVAAAERLLRSRPEQAPPEQVAAATLVLLLSLADQPGDAR